MSEFFGRRTPGSNVRVNPEPGRQVRDDALDGTGGGTQDFMSMLNSYFEAFNVSKAVRETTNAFVLGLQGMQRNLVELGMRQVFDQLQTGADNIDNPLRGGFIGGLGQLESYAPELYEFFDDIFGDNDTISNVEFGSAFGIPEEKLPFTESALLEAVNKLPTELTDGNSYELSDEDKTALLGSDPTEVDLNDYVDARYVTAAEAADIFKEQNGYKPNKEELDLFRGQRDQVATEQQIAEHVDPRQLTLAELEGIAAEQGYKLNVGDIEERVGQASEIDDDDYERRLGVDAGVYFDQNAVTSQELIDMSNDPNVGYVFSQEELEDLVGNTDEAALKDEYDLLGTSREELVQIALDEGYRIEDLTEEEIESLTGNVKESKAVDLIDPRATSVVEVQELVKNRTGDDISTTAAQQILTTIRDENDLDSNVPISENQLNTHVRENIELNIGYQIERMTTAARNLIFGTGPGGAPKTLTQILEEMLEQQTAGPLGMGYPIKVTFDPTRGTWAELKIPVPLPVNGPPIEIPLFDKDGNYEGPASVSELLVDPTSGVVTQVVDGVEQTIGRIKDGARTAVEIFGAAGEVIRTVPIFNTGEVNEEGFAIYQPTDWTEGGDYNPWELDPDSDGTINTQVDANGNELTGFDPDTGLPVYEQPEDPDDSVDNEDPDGAETMSPYDEGAEASEEFYGNFPEGTDPNDYVTQQQLADAIDALDIPEDTVRTDEEIKDLAQGIIDELDLPEDTQISDEDLATAISTYLTDNGYTAGDATRTDEEINALVSTALTDYATVQGVQDTLNTYFGEDGSVTKTLTALGFDTDEIKDIIGTPSNYKDPETGEVTEEATGMYALVEGAATPQDIINAVGVPTTNESGEVIGGTGLYGELFTLGVDVGRIEDAIGNEDEGTGLYGYISGIRDDIVQNYIGEPEYGVDADGNTTDEIVGGTGLYGVMFGIDAGNDAALEAFIGTAPTKDADGNLIGGSGLLLTLAQQGVDIEDLPAEVERIVGTPTTNENGEVIGGTGLYGDMYNLGIDVGRIEGLIGNPEDGNGLYGVIGTPAAGDIPGTGLYGYIDTAVQDLATVADVERIVGVPDFIEGTDEDGNPTRELTDKSTGLYLDFYNAGVDYDTVINLIGVPDDPSTPDVNEGRGLFGYVGQSSQNVQDYIDTVLGDVPGQITTLVGYVGVPGDPETGEGATGLHRTLFNQGVAIDAIPGIIEGIVGVPEYGVDGDGNPTDEIVGGTGLYGSVFDLDTDINTVITSINDTIIPEITSISGFLGTPGAEVDDPNTPEDETLPTGLFATIEANRAAGETERDAIIDAINTFTSDGQYTIEQVLTAIGDSNTDLKNFIGSPGADVDDPNTPEDETLPTGIYAGIAGSESTILDAISESDDNTDEYLTYISNIIGVPVSEITQEDVDGIVGLLGEEEAITDINNDIRLYDANFDGVINDVDIELLQGFVDAGVEGVGEIPATGLYADAARRQFELQGYIDASDDVTRGLITSETDRLQGYLNEEQEITRGLIGQEAADTRQLVGQTALFNAMLGAGDATGRRVDVSTPDPARINYMYDFSDIFATPQQKGLFPSPYGGPQRAQQQQISQRRGIMSGPLQIGGMAQGGKVDYDFTDEIMQIMSYGDN